ncbi:hypothetical protein BX666DRAFT_2118647 [Dichotomocladium elegans]|nr:hypothetical protein BX666DRAFT_2118647 [Dichotomocladium elegans]
MNTEDLEKHLLLQDRRTEKVSVVHNVVAGDAALIVIVILELCLRQAQALENDDADAFAEISRKIELTCRLLNDQKTVFVALQSAADAGLEPTKPAASSVEPSFSLSSAPTEDESSLRSIPSRSGRVNIGDIPLFQVPGITMTDTTKKAFSSVEEFLRRFQLILEAGEVEVDRDWGYNWSQVREVFAERFEGTSCSMSAATKVFSMMMPRGVSILDYGDEYQETIKQAGLKDDENMALRFLFSLEPDFQQDVRVAWHEYDETRGCLLFE